MVAYYALKIDEDMITRAVKTGQLEVLYCIFCYNKNYQERVITDTAVVVEDLSSDPDN